MSSKTIVITGASRGLGRAMAEGFLDLDHTVIGCSRASTGPDLGENFHYHSVDIASPSDVETFAQRVLNDHGAADLLINNAALINENAPLWEVSDKEFTSLLDVNLRGIANTVRSFVPAMI
ncbi:MAG: SDR family NAD(P)-dependent oxidoreductase, partial [Verrucomicrobiota bacterium]